MSFSQNQRFRWIAALVLGVYGTAGVLGYGLHALWHCDNCHDHVHVAESSVHCHGDDCDHHHSHAIPPAGERLLLTDDECSICAFLAQAQSEQVCEAPELVTTVSPADPPASELADLPDIIRLHLARGPPLV